MTFTLRTEHAPSLFPQCWEYLAAGATGQDEHGKLVTVPVSIRRGYVPPKMIVWEPKVVINGVAETWNPDRDYSKT